MRAPLSVVLVVSVLGCGPTAPLGDEAGLDTISSTTASPSGSGSTGAPPVDPTPTTSATTITTFDTDPGDTSSDCRSLDLPCGGWCTHHTSCSLGHVCVDQMCTVGPPLPVCDEIPLQAVNWGLSRGSGALTLVDVDADGDRDLAVVEPSVAQLEILINDGAGGFSPGSVVALGPPFEFATIATGDLDGDSDLDAVIGRADGHDVLVLFADGGTWSPGPTLPGPAAAQLFVADVNGFTGSDVLAVSASDPALTLWRGDGVGGFAERQDMPVLLGPLASLVDVTGDGRPDVVGPYDHAIAIYRGQPSAWFESEITFSIAGSKHHYRQVIPTQLDLTPELELAALVEDDIGMMIHVWRATVDPPNGWSSVNYGQRTAATPTSARIADFTGDGIPDLIATTTTDALMLLPGDGTGGFLCEALVPLPTAVTHASLAVGDIDGDGREDIVAAGPGATEVWVLRAL